MFCESGTICFAVYTVSSSCVRLGKCFIDFFMNTYFDDLTKVRTLPYQPNKATKNLKNNYA